MPPTPLTLHTLLSLAYCDKTAIEISEQIAIDTQGTLMAQDSTLYKALHRMERNGMIERLSSGRCRITQQGWQVLKGERVRIERANSLLRQLV